MRVRLGVHRCACVRLSLCACVRPQAARGCARKLNVPQEKRTGLPRFRVKGFQWPDPTAQAGGGAGA
eukprot:9444400-Alexandrium_andersonii.AAC.1